MTASMTIDPAFRSIPKNHSAFLIWRIEKMKVVAVPKEKYGNFYSGDSYIILSIKQSTGPLEMHIHFWLGAHTSQDEAGAAAIKSVELDDALGGAPVQHREVQGHETKRFVSYFKDGMRYLEGGVASGFNHVDNTLKPRLFQVKGKRNVRVWEVAITWESMNDGDSFILDTGGAIFIWNGRQANRREKMQSANVANKLKGERGGAHVAFVDDGQERNDLNGEEMELFNKHLPLSQKNIKPCSESGADDVFDRKTTQDIKLYRCSDEGGTLKVAEVKTGPLHKADLDSNDSFIIDNGFAGIWVWVGRKASKKERTEAMRNAQGFIKKKGYPNATQVTRVIDGGEPVEFKTLFNTWRDPDAVKGLGRTYTTGRVAQTVQTKFDASTMHENTQMAAQTQLPDDGTGEKQVWRIEDMKMVPVDKRHDGQFYSGDCYVILYTYRVGGGGENFIIYYWQGKYSSQDERAVSAAAAVELDDKYGGKPVQVRVVEGKEPPHFMAMFQGRMVVFQGGKASGFRNTGEQDVERSDTYLLHVRGTSSLNTKAVEVEKRGASLNSNDVFVLNNKASVFIWAGKGCSGDEREMAKVVATGLTNRDPQLIVEGMENEEFWSAIGGKEEYANDRRLKVDSLMMEGDAIHSARLFQASNASGKFTVDEIVEFSQSDLVEEDVMILDAWDNIFIWIGNGANATEKKQSVQACVDYVKTDPSNRDEDTPIIKVSQGYEPPNFTGFFGVWDRNLWNNNKTYEEMMKDMKIDNPGIQTVNVRSTYNGTMDIPKYPYEDLTKPTDELPEGVDPATREVHLNEEDFRKVFGMAYSDFATKPTWKQQQMKKSAKLF